MSVAPATGVILFLVFILNVLGNILLPQGEVTLLINDDIDKSIKWAVNSTGPVLLSVMLDPDEVFPPLRTKIEQRRRDIMGKI